MPAYNAASAQADEIRLEDVNPCSTCGARPLGVCADLKGHELQEMACTSETVTAQPGQALFHEGDPNPFVFNVVEGAVKLYRLLPDGRRQITGFLFQGDFLGLGGRGPSSFTAEALTPMSACRFRRGDFDQLLNALPALEHRLVAMAGDELMAAQEQIVLLGRKTARERIASFLTRLSARQVQLGGAEGLANAAVSNPKALEGLTRARAKTQTDLEAAEAAWVEAEEALAAVS